MKTLKIVKDVEDRQRFFCLWVFSEILWSAPENSVLYA
jgi:hypothetical protein